MQSLLAPTDPPSEQAIQEDGLKKEMSTILSYLTEIGEILWFDKKSGIQDLIICKPMDFIQSLRNIITHKLTKNCMATKFKHARRDIEMKGIISFENFASIYEGQMPAKDMWDVIAELGLGFLLKKEVMIIPSLISDQMGPKIMKDEEELHMADNSLCLNYHFDYNESTADIYFKLLDQFAKCFFWEDCGGDLCLTYGQKVEKRRLGLVNGASGDLRWLTKDIRRSEGFDFLIMEYETNESSADEKSAPFATHKVIRIHLRPKLTKDDEDCEIHPKLTKDVFEIFQKLDKHFTSGFEMKDAQRSLSCKKCQKEGRHGIFFLDSNLKIKSDSRFCDSGHSIPDDIEWMMEMSGKADTPFRLKELMKRDKTDLELEKFADSKIKADMLAGTLKPGAQIWIYHDKETDWCNPMARWNPYSHCVVYIGETNKVHEVVHVYKAWSALFRLGLLKGTILRMDVKDVIKPNQMVFLGHKIEGCQFAGNVQEKIAERAKKCTDPQKPSILFDYDHRMNCETFCNKIFFDLSGTSQGNPRKCIKCFFGCLNMIRCSEKKTLIDQLNERLNEDSI